MEVPIELCQSAKVYKPDPIRRYVLLGSLLAIYAFSIPFCYYTAGEPRKAAMIAAQKLADEKWALESSATALLASEFNSVNTTVNIGDSNSSDFTVDVSEGGQLVDIDEQFISTNEFSGTLVEMDSSGGAMDIIADDIFNSNIDYIGNGADGRGNSKKTGDHEDDFDVDHVVSFDNSADAKG